MSAAAPMRRDYNAELLHDAEIEIAYILQRVSLATGEWVRALPLGLDRQTNRRTVRIVTASGARAAARRGWEA